MAMVNGHRSQLQNGHSENHHEDIEAHLNSTRAQRIRAAIFPEFCENDSVTFINGHMSAVQKLSEPSQLLKNAVVDIINYKEDAEIAEKALPELLRLLNDDDPTVSAQAATILHSLAQKEASRSAMCTGTVVQVLIQSLNNPRYFDSLRQSIAGVLYCLTQNSQGRLVLLKTAAIPVLVKFLDSPNDGIVNYALSSLHNLLLHIDQAKLEILRCGGCQKMVGRLTSRGSKFLAMLTDCLHMLAFNNEEVKIIIESSDGPQQLLRILDSNDYEKLLWTTTRLLRVLSVSPSIKIVMVSKNAIKILEKHLSQSKSLRIRQNSLQILRNLSDQAVKLENLDSLLRLLIQLLRSNDLILVSCSVGIISNLTCNNQYNKMSVVQYQGVPALVQCLEEYQGKEEIIEPVICALRHITCRHSHSSEAQNAVRLANGLLPIVDLLNVNTNSWPIVKSSISLIRNLALSMENLPNLREIGAIQKLAQLLVRSHQELQKQASNNPGALIDNYIRMEDVLEACVSALHMIAKDQQNRAIIRDLDCIPLFVRLLYPPSNVSIQRAAAGVLCELVNDRQCATIIEQENCAQKLTDLLKSTDEALATYAAAILFRLSEDKPNEVKKRLSQDVSSALHRDDHGTTNHYASSFTSSFRPAVNGSVTEVPMMNFYASEGTPGSGLVENGAWFDTDL